MTKKRILYLVYGILGGLALLFLALGIAWAVQDTSMTITEERAATVELSEDARSEYVMGQPLDLSGVRLKVERGGETKLLSPEECTVDGDTSRAGAQSVTLSWQEGTILHTGSYPIKVYGVRHLDVRSVEQATRVYRKSDTALSKSGIVVWAELSEEPGDSFIKPHPDYRNVVQLEEDMFTLTSGDLGKSGIHYATLQSGKATAGFQFAVEGIAVDTSSAVTDYGVGEEFLPANVFVTATSLDYVTAENPLGTKYIDNYRYSQPDLSAAGKQQVTVSYGAVTAKYTINVYYQSFPVYGVTPGYTFNFYWSKGPTVASEGRFKVTYTDANGVRRAETNTWGHYGDNFVIWTYNGRIDTCTVLYGSNAYRWNTDADWRSYGAAGASYGFRYLCGNGAEIEARGNISDLRATQDGIDAREISVEGDFPTEFDAGDRFSSGDLRVNAALWNGGSRALDPSEYTVSAPDLTTAGIKTVTISYGKRTVSYEIAVRGLSVQFERDGSGLEANLYEPGGTFDETSLTIRFVRGLGDVTELSLGDCNVVLPSLDAPGAFKAEVSYEDGGRSYSVSLPVYVGRHVLSFTPTADMGASLALYAADSRSGRTAYWVYRLGDTTERGARYVFDETQMRFALYRNIQDTNPITIGAIEEGRLRVDLGGETFLAEGVEWEPALLGLRVKRIEVEAEGAKTFYTAGESFSAAGIRVTAYYNDGTSAPLSGGDFEVTAPDLSSAGVKTVTVRHGDCIATYSVTVGGYGVDFAEAKRVFEAGEPFSHEGLKVYEYGADGAREITSFEAQVTLGGVGVYEVNVSFAGGSCSYFVAVIPAGVAEEHVLAFPEGADGSRLVLYVSSITGGGNDAAAAHAEGAYFLFAVGGGISKYDFVYDYDPNGYRSTFSSEILEALDGAGRLVVTVGGASYTAEADVWHSAVMNWQKKLKLLSVDYSAAKREYLVGGAFSPNGIVVRAHYENGAEEVLSPWQYRLETPDMTSIGVKTVTISYQEGTDTVQTSYQIYAIPDVPWETNKLDFSRDQDASLELFIMDRTGGGDPANDATAHGWYLVKKADGGYLMGELFYSYAAEGSVSSFDSDSFEESTLENGNLQVRVEGFVFTVGADTWHRVMMLWN